MKRTHSGLLIAGALFLFAGCNGSNNPASPGSSALSDEEEINEIVAQEMADYFISDFLDSETDGAASKSADPIGTDRWRREITGRSGNLNIEYPGDGSAEIVWNGYIEGNLHLVDFVDSLTTVEYQKPFADSITRRAVMRRRDAADPRPPYRRWYLESISMGEAVSQPVNTVEITSLEVANLNSGYTQSYSDPYALLDRETEIPEFSPGEEVEVVVTAGSTDLYAYLHTNRHRLEMTNNGDGTYSGTYIVPSRLGAHYVAIDLLTEETNMDDLADYDGNAWATHYRVQ